MPRAREIESVGCACIRLERDDRVVRRSKDDKVFKRRIGANLECDLERWINQARTRGVAIGVEDGRHAKRVVVSTGADSTRRAKIVFTGQRSNFTSWDEIRVERPSRVRVELDQHRIMRSAGIERCMKVRMRAESEWHYRVASIGDASLQSQSITYFVVYFQHERPRPDRSEIRIVRRIENRCDKVGPAPRHAKGAFACEAVNRVAARGFVHRQPVLAALERKACAGDAARPWKENRNAAAMWMLAPCVRIGRPGDDFQRANAIAQALAAGCGNNHRALALRFQRYEFQRDGSIPRSVDRDRAIRGRKSPSSE